MIKRYTLPEMANLWTDEARFHQWVKVELAVLEAQESLGQVPQGVTETVRQKARFDIQRIQTIETEVKHDVIAFLTNLAESVGEESRFVHLGMTSSDLLDTALALQIQAAGTLLEQKLRDLIQTLHHRATEHQYTPMIGRSHGIHGEPITFGLKLLVWIDELERHQCRLKAALEENRVGQVSGAMGTYAHLNPQVEVETCQRLGLIPARISTQIIGRDRHATFLIALAQLTSSIEKMAVEIRNLQRTDVLEVEEPFTAGQKGSSAMPHKRNPVSSENMTGLARLVRSYVIPALENVAVWHERDISHSSVERVVFPDACILTHYMLNRFNKVMSGLVVYPENMARNMNLYGGAIFSQRVLLALINKGLSREEAYKKVQRNAHAAWNTPGGDFKNNLMADSEITRILSHEEILDCLSPDSFLTHVDAIFQRFPTAS